MQSNYILRAREKYESYDPSCWTKAYFDDVSGGFNVYHKKHKFSSIEGGGNAEIIVGQLLAMLGKHVEFLPEGEAKSPDIRFDERTWDIKSIEKANEETIRTYIKDARKADKAIFYWTTGDDKLETLKNAIGRSVGYFKSKNAYQTMPDIYYMDNGILKLLWSK
ncbi:hypothetical protein AGMMS4957_01220 [Bacteroidia bacterium]|nr:hypothetical protein AGMMS4957_01220 [Bacteroidia bacterium]